ncbi:MAG: T9SS type A sorting domain-containing protein [Aureispira sp.]|nr:T9SS type A sorting domain-containing protein [Aureispira sp.]
MKTSTLLLIYSLIFSYSLQAQIYVNLNATGNNDGSSWSDAYTNLQAAINSAADSSTIWVATGTYYPTESEAGDTTPTDNRIKRFYFTKNIQLYGGFSGVETQLNQRNFNINITRLSGDLGTINDNSDNAYCVVYIKILSPNSNNMIIDGFHIEDGNADGSGFNQNGGGLTLYGRYSGAECKANIQNNTFNNNHAANYGGAIFLNPKYNTPSQIMNPDIRNNTFINNTAYFGAALGSAVNSVYDLVICNNTFRKNAATFRGSAIFLEGSTSGNLHATIDSCIVDSNSRSAFSIKGKYIKVTNSHFVDNYNSAGSAMLLQCDTAIVDNCTFYDNMNSGGAVCSKGSLDLRNSIFKGNSALPGNSNGGAVFINITSFPTLGGAYTSNFINNLFYNNTAREGGAIAFQNSYYNTNNITNNTFYGNSANDSGGAIQDYSSNSSIGLYIKNSIFWNNQDEIHTDNSVGDVFCNYCIIQDSIDDGTMILPTTLMGSNNIDQNPLFVDALNGDFRLQNNSPAIDAGDNAAWNNTGLTTDLANNNRPIGNSVDIGAYEALVILDTEKLDITPIEVFPNPSSGELTVHLDQIYDDLEVQLFTLTGQLVQSQIFNNQDRLNLRISGDSGVYLLKIQSSKGHLSTMKILKI